MIEIVTHTALVSRSTSDRHPIEESVWLGDIPIATVRPNSASVSVFYVHNDQLNTPRQITRTSDNAFVPDDVSMREGDS
jgi:hypothetical protein